MKKLSFGFSLILLLSACSGGAGSRNFNFFYQKDGLQVSVARMQTGEPWRCLVLYRIQSGKEFPIDPETGDTLRHSMLVITLTDEAGNLLAPVDTNVTSVPEPDIEDEFLVFISPARMKSRGGMNGYNTGKEMRHAFFVTPDSKKRGWINSKLKFEMYLYSFHAKRKPGGRERYSRIITKDPWISVEVPMYVKF